MYLLDTNVCIEIINGRPAQVREHFEAAVKAKSQLFVSSITSFELRYGAEKSDRKDFNHSRVDIFLAGPVELITFEDDDAKVAGKLRADLEARGKMIGPFDTLLAAQALQRDLIMVTANTREFSRVKGLACENWSR